MNAVNKDNASEVYVYRVVFVDPENKKSIDHLRGMAIQNNKNVVTFKALSKRNGNNRRKVISPESGGMQFKANVGRQIGRSIISTIVPGDMSPIRSPVRSAFWRAVTPGFGGGRRGGSLPGENRGYRCPEGYQYGGRFTDNRLSTCGAQLFDIPSVLGAALRAIRNAIAPTSRTTGTPITGIRGDSNIIVSRAPVIPKVATDNKQEVSRVVPDLTKQIGKFNKSSNEKARRMVRRDGFVLEPVVPNKVLRAIPDNRDMEGATMLMSTLSPSDVGGEELGLLSNTGIRSLIYVLPGGSTLTLEKARKLSVGERRKLGRVVNSAAEIDNDDDPAKRLQFVASEIGPGLSYSENFVGIKNPNERIGKDLAWVKSLFKNRKLVKPEMTPTERETISFAAKGKLIKNVEYALQHISSGGNISDVHSSIIAEVIKRSSNISKRELQGGITAIDVNGKGYLVYNQPKKFQHIAERFASDVQQHLGLESPDVLFAGKQGNARSYIREDISSVIPGGVFNPQKTFNELDMHDVARMMVADFLTDQRERPNTSIYAVDTNEGTRSVLAQNTTSGLVDLSKLEITKRMKMRLGEYYDSELIPSYSDYYQKLRAEQRILFIKLISQMINRARSFNPRKFNDNMNNYGLSEGEKIHINIVTKLFDQRIEFLSSEKQSIRQFLSARKEQ